MTPNARLFLGLGVIELGLAVLWIWLAKTAAQSSSDPAAQAVIGQIIGDGTDLRAWLRDFPHQEVSPERPLAS